MKKIIYSGLVACSVVLTSCGDKEKASNTAAVTEAAVVALGPVDTVLSWKDNAESGKLTGLWSALPASYQSDAQGLVQAFGENVDAEVYGEAVKTLTAANNLLKNKKGLILEMLESMAPPEKQSELQPAKENWDKVTELLDAVLTSDAKSAAGLQSIDVAAFSASLESKIKPLVDTAIAMNKQVDLNKVTAELVSEDGDKAVVNVTSPEGDTEEVTLVRVEDRWIPEEMSTGWSEGVAKAMAGMKEGMKESDKQQALGMMKMVQGVIAEMNEANTAEEFQGAAMKAMGGFMR